MIDEFINKLPIIDSDFLTPEEIAKVQSIFLNRPPVVRDSSNKIIDLCKEIVEKPVREDALWVFSKFLEHHGYEYDSIVDYPLRIRVNVLAPMDSMHPGALTYNQGYNLEPGGRMGMFSSQYDPAEAVQSPHTDAKFQHYVFLYYVNDAVGDTIFFKNFVDPETKKRVPEELEEAFRVTPKAGKAIIFNGLQFHAPTVPTSGQYRGVINLPFMVK